MTRRWLAVLVAWAVILARPTAATSAPSCQVGPPDVACSYIDGCSVYTLVEALRNATASAAGSPFNVVLERSAIADFPANVFQGHRIKELHVRYSVLPVFPPACFGHLDAGLTKLDLPYNGVAALDPVATKSLPFRTGLAHLSLYQNALTSVAPFAFVDFPFLDTLDLSRNLLRALPDYAFGGLAALGELQLSGNQISAVGRFAFSRMDKLTTLNLGDNWIATLANDTFNDRDMPAVANVWLPYNIFACDCRLQWLKEYLTRHGILEDSRGTCETPRFATFADVDFCPPPIRGQRIHGGGGGGGGQPLQQQHHNAPRMRRQRRRCHP